ncbi:MAG: hypothetical protein AAGE98_04205 [Actinomycetota bacterium]
MSSPRSTSARALDAALSGLARQVTLAHSGANRLMIGRGGMFVLRPIESGDDAAEALAEVERLAIQTRERIASHLAWVPFVDWFVVGDDSRTEQTVLAPDLVGATALERETIGEAVLEDLRRLVDAGELMPMWFKGVPAAWERGFAPSISDTAGTA